MMKGLLSPVKGILYTLVLTLLATFTATAQSWNMVNGDTVHIDACSSTGGTIYDDGGIDGNYANSFSGWVVIEAAEGVSITLSGSYQLEGCCDYITVWDGNPTTGSQLWNNCGSGTLSLTATSGRMTLRFTTDGSVTYSGFALTWSREGWGTGSCTSGITSLEASGVTQTTATLSWTAAATSLYLDYGQGEQYLSVAGNGIFLSGLNPNTLYDVKLYGAGELGSPCCVARTSFRTACGPMVAPMVERFDDLQADTMPPCWSMGKNFDDASLYPRVTTAAAKSGSKSLMLSSGNNTTATHFGIVMGPNMSDPIGGLNVHVSLRSNMAGAKVEVGVCDTVSGMYTYYGFTAIDTLTIAQSGQWYDYTVPMSSYNGDGTRLAFRMMQGMQPGGGCMIYIDDIMAENCGVDSLRVTNRSHDGMTLSWTLVSTPTVTLTVSGGGQSTSYSGVTSPYRITGLDPQTQYTLTLTPQCGNVYTTPKSIAVTTLSGSTMPLQYCQDFEAGWPSTWYRPETYGSNPERVNNSGYCMRMYHYNENENTVVLPRLTVSPDEVQLRIKMRPDVGGSGVVVGVMDYPLEMSSFTPVDTLINPSNAYRYMTADLSDYSGSGRYLALRTYSPTSGNQYIYVDDVSVGRCLLTGLTVAATTAHTVTLAWDSTAYDLTDSVIIEYGASSFVLGSGTRVALMATTGTGDARQSYTVEGLTEATAYQFVAYRKCTDAVCLPERVSATTHTRDYTVPYCEDFEGFDDGTMVSDWQRPSMYDGCPRINDPSSNTISGTGVLRLATVGPISGGYQHSTAVLPMLDYTGDLDDLVVSFYGYTNRNGNAWFEVGVMTEPMNENTFVCIKTVRALYNTWQQYVVSLADTSEAPLPHPTTGHVAIRFTHDCGWCNYSGYIDNLEVREGGVTGMTVHSNPSGSIVVSPHSVGQPGDITLRLIAGDDTVTSNVPSAIHTISGLEPGTWYRYEIDYGQCYPIVGTLRTMPYCEGFDNFASDSYPSDWARPSMYDGCPKVNLSGNPLSGTMEMRLATVGPISGGYQHSTAVLPHLYYGDSIASLVLSCYAWNYRNGNAWLEVGVMSDPTDESTFTLVESVRLGYNYWQRVAVSFAGYTGGDGHIALRYTHDCGWCNYSSYIENLEVGAGAISSATVYSPRSDGATLSFGTMGTTGAVTLSIIGGDDTVTVQNVSSPYTISGLQPGIAYTCQLTADGCFPVSVGFTTRAEALQADWCYGFETDYSNNRPNGWNYPYLYNIGSSDAYSGSRSLYMYLYEQNRNAAILPYLEETNYSGIHLTFRGKFSGNGNRFIVGLLSDPRDTVGLVPLDTISVADNVWRLYDYDLTGHEGDGHHMAFVQIRNTDGCYWCSSYSYVDDLRLARGDIDSWRYEAMSTAANIWWTTSGNVDSVQIELTLGDSTVCDTTLLASLGTAHITGLEAGTTYTLTLTAINNQSHRGCAMHTYQLVTLDQDVQAGWCEAFADSWPSGWVGSHRSAAQPTCVTDSRYNHRALDMKTGTGLWNSFSTVVLPYATEPLNGLVLGFDAWSSSDGINAMARLVVGVMTDRNDTSTFVGLDTLAVGYFRKHYAVNLATYNGNGHYLALRAHAVSGYNNTIYIADIHLSTCAPADLRIRSVGANSVELAWQRLGYTGTTVMRYHSGDSVWTEATSSGTSLQLDGLLSGATYTFRMAAVCQDTSLECQWTEVTFPMPNAADSVPLCLGMDDYIAGTNLPWGWTRPYGNVFPRTTTNNYRGGRALEFRAYRCNAAYDDNSSMAVSPYIVGGLDGAWLDFYYRNQNGAARFIFGTIANPCDTSTFVAHDTLGYRNDWTHVNLSLAAYSGHHLAIKYEVPTSCNGAYGYIDNMELMGCPMPDVWISHQQDTSLRINFTGQAPVWIEYGLGSSLPQSGTTRVLATASPYTVEGLQSASSYAFRVWPECSGADADEPTFMCNYQTLVQLTMHPAADIPYCYNFEGVSSGNYPDEWNRQVGYSGTEVTGTTDGHSDSRALWLRSDEDASATALLPKLDVATGCHDSVFLNFWYHWNTSGGTLAIGTVTDLSDTASFTSIDTLVRDDGNWHHHTSAIPAAMLADGRIALRISGGRMRVDNLCVETCVAADVNVGDLTQHTATISWDGHGVDTLVCEYGLSGFAQGTGTVLRLTSSPYTITGLSSSSDYNFIFRTVCSCPNDAGVVYPYGGGSGGSGVWRYWIDTTIYPGAYGTGGGGGWGGGGGIVIGTSTQAEMLATPYCEDFDSMNIKLAPPGWRTLRGSTAGYPQVVRTPAYSGARSLDFYTTTGYSNHAALQPVADPSALVMSFMLYSTNSEMTNRSLGAFTVGVMTNPDQGETFVPIDTVTLSRTGQWRQCFVDLSSYSGTGQYIAFRFTPRNASYHVDIDNIYLGSTVVTSATATVGADGVTVEYSTIGSASGVIVEWDSTSSATLQASGSLLPGTSPDGYYELRLRAFGVADTQADCHLMPIIVNPVLFLPYCQDFESVSGLLPTNWTTRHTNNVNYPNVGQCGQHGTGELMFAPYNNASGHEVVLLPPLADGDTIGDLYIDLDYRANTDNWYNYNYSWLDLGYLTDTANWNTFTTLLTLHNTDYSQHHSVQLPACTATQLALRARSTSGTRYFHIDNLFISRLPLPITSNTTAPNIGYRHKRIQWNADPLATHYQYEWGPAGFAQGTGTLATSDSCSLTISGLEAGTDYDIYFIDSTGHYACQPYRFVASTPHAMPYCENFDSYGSGGSCRPTGWNWTFPGNDALYTTSSYDYSLQFYSYYYNTSYIYASMPELDIDSMQRLTMHLRYQYREYATVAEVGVMETPTAWSTFVPIDTLPCNLNNWSERIVNFASYTGSGRFVAIRFRGNQYQYNYLFVDRVYMQDAPVPTYTLRSYHSLDVTTPNLPAGGYWLEICHPDTAVGNGRLVHITDTVQRIDGLQAATAYRFYSRRCEDGTSCYYRTVTTPRNLGTTYCDNFDGYGSCGSCRPTGWYWTFPSNDALYTTSSYDYSLEFYSYYYNTGYIYAAMPDFGTATISELSMHLRYQYREYAAVAEVGVMDSPTGWSSFVPVDTLPCNLNNWSERIIDFYGYTGSGRFIAIRLRGNQYQYNYLFVDRVDVQDTPIPTYRATSSHSVVAVLDSAIAAPDYYIEVCHADSAQGTGRVLHVTTHNFTIDSLLPQTTYKFYARKVDTNASCYYRTVTMPRQMSLPLCENFDSYGSCGSCRPTGWYWTFPGSDALYTTSSYDYSLQFYSYYYNTGYIYATMPDMDIDSIRNLSMHLRYQYRDYAAVAEVGVMTSPTLWSSFVPVDTLPCNLNNWSTYTVDFARYAGNGRFVAIRFRGNQYQYNYFFLDRIRLQSCPMPTYSLCRYNTIKCALDTIHTAADYWVHITDGDALDSMIHVDSNPFYITNLNATTTYTLTTLCDSAIETCLPSTTITTGELQTLPYCENFDSYGSCGSCYPTGWMKLGMCSSDEIYTTSSNGYSLRMYSYYYNSCWQYAIMPDMDIDSIQHLSIQLRFRMENTSCPIDIGVMEDPTRTSSFTPVKSYTPTTNLWYNESIDFASYQGNGRYIAIRMRANSYQYNYLYVDYLRIQPFNLPQYSLTSPTAISITSSDSLWLRCTGTNMDSTFLVAGTYLLDNLAENSTYNFYYLADSATPTCFSPTAISTTHSVDVPWCENFNSYDSSPAWSAPTGWIRINEGEYNYPRLHNSNTVHLDFHQNKRQIFITPYITTDDIGSLTLTARYRTDNTSDRMVIGVMSNPYDLATFTPVDTIAMPNTSWGRHVTPLASYNDPEAHFIAFKYITTQGYSIFYVDDLRLEPCLIPDGVSVALVNSNTVQVDESTGFYVEYGPSGFEQGAGTFEYIDIVPYDITLNYETTYDFYFRCDTVATTCRPKQTITTLAPPVELSHCEDFDTYNNEAMPTGWLKYRLPEEYGNNCFVYNGQSHTASKSLRMCSYYPERHPYAVMRELDVDSLNKVAISFWTCNAHKDNFSLDLGTVSNPYDMSTFVPLRRFTNTANNVWQRQQAVLDDAPADAHYLALRFNSNIYSWDWLYVDDLHIDSCGASDLQIVGIESESVTLDWRQTGNPTITLDIIPIGDTPQQLTINTTPPYTVTGLNPLTSYMIRLNSACENDEASGYCSTAYLDSVRFFTPAGGTGCIDPTNLTADYVTCFTGSYRNPYSNIGMVDSGAASTYSRHTVHYNPSERDPRTGNHLRTVPDGASASVRLGNWGTHKISNTEGGEAEAITYALFVDTMAFDLLIMRYAAVMQDPMHAAADQPRFRLELLDSSMTLIDPVCGAADFIANQNLGWNTVGADEDIVLWKDWTTVGLDMSAYAGQTVYIRLTTYDCNEGSHYGYAYFTLDCMRKSMSAEGCGNVASNVFTAPSGFAYRWYSNQSDTTFSTSQSIDVASNNDITYYCNLSFVDNDACNFTMSAFAGTRFPLSLFDSAIVVSNCQFEVAFNNHSTISMDGTTPVGTGEGVETAWWSFGNGSTSNNYHASTIYDSAGTYTVTLITAIAGGACTDTLEKAITLVFPPTNPRIEGPTDHCYGSQTDTLVLLEANQWTVWASDTLTVAPLADTTYILTATDSNGCQHTVSHVINVHPVYDLHTYDTICDGQQYLFSSDTMTVSGSYPFALTTSGYGCDSSHTLHLTVNDNTVETVNDTVNETELPHNFNDISFTDSTTGYVIHTTNAVGCDSTITYNLTVIWNPRWTDLDSTVCRNALPIVWNNVTMSDSGTYTALFTSSHGQDSTVTMHLHTVPVYSDTVDYSICDNEQYQFEDSVYYGTDAGLHSHLLHTALYGCDSLRTLDLAVRATTTGDTIADECDTFYWYGTAYTANTDEPTHLSTNAALCDSTTTLHLTIRNSTSSVIEETVVENELPYTFNGVTFNDSTDLTTITIANAVGCDSVIGYTLHIDWNTGSRLDSNICFNQLPITWNNEVFDTAAMGVTMMRTVVIPSTTGSDSTIIMRVHVRPVYNDTIAYSICDNEQYTFEDSIYYGTDAGLHSHLLHTAIYSCDSLRTLNLEVRPTTTGDTIVDECDTFYWYGTAYTANTDEPTHLSQNSIQCDSTTTLHLTIRYSTSSIIEETIVENELPYTFNGVTFTDSTDLTTITIANAVGCDSVIAYKLNIDWNTGSRLDSNVCFNQLPIIWNNEVFDTTAMGVTMMRTVVIPSATGSDSTVVMRVHVRPVYSDTIPASICDNEQYQFEDSVYYGTDAGLHSLLLHTAIYGCDSLRTLNLEVRPTTTGDTIADECDTFYWYGTAYTANTDEPTYLSTNAALCDSTTTLHLTIRYSTSSIIEETIVENELPYTFNGVTFTDSTDLTTITIPNTVGCDSVIAYKLNIDWNTGSRLDSNICFNQLPITWNNEVFDTTIGGTTLMRTVVIPSATGADSTIIMRVHVRPVYNDTIPYSICDNEQYTFEDSVYYGTDAGLHSHLLHTAIYGCDSLRCLDLAVRATTTGDTVADECDIFYWYGTAYTASTDEPTHLCQNSVQCDSTTTLHLTIQYSTTSTIHETIVENDLPYTFNGRVFTENDFGGADADEHDTITSDTITIDNSVGCDSVINYTLRVEWNTGSRLDSNVCFNQLPITWNNEMFDTIAMGVTMMRTVVIPSATGSDSTIIMRVHVRPVYNDTIAYSICDNEQYTFEDSVYYGTDAGLHSHLLHTAIYGCDSLRTLDLAVRATTTGDTIADECDTFYWYGTTYTASTDEPTHLSTNAALCDSTTTLHLNIRHSTTSIYYDTVIENLLPHTFNGMAFTDSVSHTAVTIANAVQCDSVIDYSLYVHWNVDTTLYDTLCNDELSFTWNGQVFDTTLNEASGTMLRTTVLTAHTGADSTVWMYLTVHPLFDHHLNTEICDNQQFAFGDSIFLGTDGTTEHLDSLLSEHGCDSLSTLHLSVHPTFNHHLWDTICSNHLYTWGTPQRTMLAADSTEATLHGSDSLTAVASIYPYDTMFTEHLQSIHGCDSLSSLHLHLLPSYSLHYYDTICAGHILSFGSDSLANWQHHYYRFEQTDYDTTGIYRHPLSTGSCDSIRTLHLTVYPTYDLHFYDTIYDGDLYIFEQTLYDTTGVYPHRLAATYGCDSLHTLHLQRNRRTYNDSTLCQNMLPLTWNGVTFTDGMGSRTGNLQVMADSVHLSGLNGIDSLVVMTVTVHDTSVTTERLHACDSLRWQDDVNHTYSTVAPYVTLQNAVGCDSVVHLALNVDYTHWATDRHTVCDSMRWIDATWYYADTVGAIDTIRTVADCDSIVTLSLTVHYSTSTALRDTMCHNQTYNWHGFSVHSDSTYLTEDFPLTDTLHTVYNCDSVVGLIVTKMALPRIVFEHTIDCQQRVYNLTVNATAPLTDGGEPQPVAYTIWSSAPTDPTLDGQELLQNISVSPLQTTDYILFADYRNTPFCPATSHIELHPITVPTAEMKVTPEALGYNNLDFTAYDISHHTELERSWYIDWLLNDETGSTLYGTAPIDADSVTVALRVYNGQCYDTAVRVLPIHHVALFAPNVFTPLRDDNNRFIIVGQGIIEGELFIYNREGLLVHHSNDWAAGWDGRRDSDGRLCLQGNYVWKLVYRAIDRPSATRTEVGMVLLIR